MLRFGGKTAVAAALCLSLAACGTTVPLSTQKAAQQTGGGNGGNDLSVGGDVGGGVLSEGSASTGGVGGPGAATGGRATAGSAPVSVSNAPRQPVKVGIAYPVGQEKAAAALGGNSEDAPPPSGDQRIQAEAFVNWANKNGGLAGHQIIPIWSPQEFTDTRSNAEKAAVTCAQWTQDNKVIAGISLGPAPNDLARCLQAAGAVYFQWGWTLHTKADYQQIPYMFHPGELGVETLAATYGNKLAENGFFGPGSKVGLLVNDYPAAQEGKKILKATLASHGVPLDDAAIYTVPQPAGWSAVTSSLQAIQNAQLKMRASGVTHVLFLCWGCASFFMVYADGQQWAPKYGMTSDDLPGTIPLTQPDLARRQLQGAMGTGWWPLVDVGAFNNPSAPVNDTFRQCQAIVAPTGQGTKQPADQMNSSGYCAGIMFLRAAATASGANPVTGAALRRGAESLGTSYQDPMTLYTNLGPNKHSGVQRGLMFRFENSCTCMKYFGNQFELS